METCRNCGAGLAGAYCSQCGQKHVAHRLNLPELLSHVFEAITELDSTVWRTVKECTRNPGQVALNYISGQRARYVNPVKFFLTIFAVYIAALSVSGTLDKIAEESIHIGPGSDMKSAAVQTVLAIQAVFKTHFNLVFFIALPLIAFLLRWQYWRAHRNYAETLAFICYVTGITSLYGMVFVPFFYFFDTYFGAPRGIILVALFLVGARTFFDMSWPRAVGGFFLSALLYVLSTVSATIVLGWAHMAGLL